jgi:hypothetical protein
VIAGAALTSGCSSVSYLQASCQGARHAVLLLAAQAVPSATYIPCVLPPPGGWSYGGYQVKSGAAQFWVNSDRAGAHAVDIRLTGSCDLAGATGLHLRSPPPGLRAYREPAGPDSRSSVRYFVFAGGCVTERFSFTRQSAPGLFQQADQFLGFTPRSVYVRYVRQTENLTLCGVGAPPCPG